MTIELCLLGSYIEDSLAHGGPSTCPIRMHILHHDGAEAVGGVRVRCHITVFALACILRLTVPT
eukprot:4515421-Amphidinium_carterae.1